MASLISTHTVDNYHGLDRIFEFTNDDGANVGTNCGQAAAATFLTEHGLLAPFVETMRRVESPFPPDNLGGYFGTSRRQVIRICRSFGMRVRNIHGEVALRAQLACRQPVIVMLGVSGGRVWKFELPAGHWMVAYGFDDRHIFLTNWGPMTWEDFRRGWRAFVPMLVQMRESGLVARRTADS